MGLITKGILHPSNYKSERKRDYSSVKITINSNHIKLNYIEYKKLEMLESNSEWPANTKELAIELHSQLKLDNLNWHHLKGNSERRAAELIAAAMVQIVSEGKPSDVVNLLTHSIKWMKREVKAPGCPQH